MRRQLSKMWELLEERADPAPPLVDIMIKALNDPRFSSQ